MGGHIKRGAGGIEGDSDGVAYYTDSGVYSVRETSTGEENGGKLDDDNNFL